MLASASLRPSIPKSLPFGAPVPMKIASKSNIKKFLRLVISLLNLVFSPILRI